MAKRCNKFTWIAQEPGAYPAWATPDTESLVTNAAFDGGPELIKTGNTGTCTRAEPSPVQGLMQATGKVDMNLYSVGFFPHVMRSMFSDVDSNASGTGYINDLLPNDLIAQIPYFSLQLMHSPTVAKSIMGAVPNNLVITAAPNAIVKCSIDFVVSDISMSGGFWSDKITAAPAVVTSPSEGKADPMPRPMMFNNAKIYRGTGVTQVGNALSITSPSPLGNVRTFALTINNGITGIPSIRQGPPTVDITEPGMRKVTLTGDIGWSVPTAEWWNIMALGEPVYLQASFVSPDEYDTGLKYELIITIADLRLPSGGANTPPLDGTQESKTQSLTLESFENDAGLDIGATLKTSDDLS